MARTAPPRADWRDLLRRFRILWIVYLSALPLVAYEIRRNAVHGMDITSQDSAVRYTESFCQLYPQRPHCDFLRGTLLLDATDDLEKARKHFARAIESGLKTNHKLLKYYAHTLVKLQADPQEIEAAVENWTRNDPRAKAAGRQMLHQAELGRQAAALFERARKRESEEQWDEAEQLYRQAIDADPSLIRAHFALADIVFHHDQRSAAIPLYQKALELYPRVPAAHSNLAMALQSAGDLDEAAKHMNESLRWRPDDAPAYFNLANILHARGELEAAVENYTKALELQPDFFDAHFNLALTYRELERLDDAADHFRQCVQLRPEDAQAQKNLADVLSRQGGIPHRQDELGAKGIAGAYESSAVAAL